MTLKDRLTKLVEKEGLNPNQFYVKSGLANGFLNTVGETLRRPSIVKLEYTFPHWNIDWLLSGNGEMYNRKETQGSINVVGAGNISNTGNMSGEVSIGSRTPLLEGLNNLYSQGQLDPIQAKKYGIDNLFLKDLANAYINLQKEKEILEKDIQTLKSKNDDLNKQLIASQKEFIEYLMNQKK